ncbi:uncharacterized protein LOC112082868 [Eutrema salsugineum]|uniref:uncharacterized protein LOC112082868 n=1 Tax=Eutrema salsugineum TaxID=72664 RepID=UPI000CED1203|nr:uncharacterized protein LOC112082868 [Eutrema salsugineum]
MKKLIWRLAWSYNKAEFEENKDKISCYDSVVFVSVMKTKPETWCRAFYKLGHYCEDVENNSTESWNASIVKARDKPFVPMLETIARLAMVRIAKRGFISLNWKSKCTPYVIDYLAEEYETAKDCTVNISTNYTYDVRASGCSYRVRMQDRTCTCRRWEITGIPCEHAYAVIIKKNLDAEDFVCHWFMTAMWRKTYTDGIVPLRGARFWPVGEEPSVHMPPSPLHPGRKKGETYRVSKKEKQRKKGKNESPVKKAPVLLKRVMHCKICGLANHNSRFHKKKGKQGAVGESSQAEPSQGALTQLVD